MAHKKALAAKDKEIEDKNAESTHKDGVIAHEQAETLEAKNKLDEDEAALDAANVKTNEL